MNALVGVFYTVVLLLGYEQDKVCACLLTSEVWLAILKPRGICVFQML